MNIESVKERIASLEAAGELSIKELFYLEAMKELCESQAQVKQLAAENAGLKAAAEFATAPDMWIEQSDGMLDYRYCDWYVDVLEAAMETPATDAFLASLRAEGVADDYFGGLVTKARASADKAMRKFPQPNYVLLKVAEEAGEVVQAGVHYVENRMTWQDVEGEIIQLLAMLIRLVTEGDQVNGITPPALCQSAPSPEAAAIARQSEQVKGVQS
ncbi:hypothetical protein MML63_12260 [Kosakonia sacchari]|uniref:hypothetical protein n=1 Tax=Kosakonia sacchari TaxID=1158459 RepID=UPI0025AF30D5|nr:hypothetical protein [Kosakonia sacchari]MDN2486398.1 hypothetical protein [Kosakonia sacchari]